MNGMTIYERICSIVENSSWYASLSDEEQEIVRRVLYSMDIHEAEGV